MPMLLNLQMHPKANVSRSLAEPSVIPRHKNEDIPLPSAAFCRVECEQPITDRQIEEIPDRKSIHGVGHLPEAKWAQTKAIWPDITDLRCCFLRESDQWKIGKSFLDKRASLLSSFCIFKVNTKHMFQSTCKVWSCCFWKERRETWLWGGVKEKEGHLHIYKIKRSSSTALQSLTCTAHPRIQWHLQADNLICSACGFMAQPSSQ